MHSHARPETKTYDHKLNDFSQINNFFKYPLKTGNLKKESSGIHQKPFKDTKSGMPSRHM